MNVSHAAYVCPGRCPNHRVFYFLLIEKRTLK